MERRNPLTSLRFIYLGAWRAGSAVKSTSCSSEDPGLILSTYMCPQPSAPPVPRDLMFSCPHRHMQYTDIHAGTTLVYRNKILKYSFIYFMSTYVPLSICMCSVLGGQKSAFGSPGTGIIGGCKLPCGSWKQI